jgi:hypothetical protein
MGAAMDLQHLVASLKLFSIYLCYTPNEGMRFIYFYSTLERSTLLAYSSSLAI